MFCSPFFILNFQDNLGSCHFKTRAKDLTIILKQDLPHNFSLTLQSKQ